MDIPPPLLSAIRTFRASLDDELYHVEHDTDVDGFASGIITTAALQQLGYDAYPYAVERSKTFVPERGAVVFTDIALNGEPVGTVQTAAMEGVRVYAIDHHPWEKGVEQKLHAYVNPHLIPDVSEPSRWNAGLLAYLTFRDVVPHLAFLAAVSVYTDRCITDWNSAFVEQFGMDDVVRAGELLTAYIATNKDLSKLDYLLLNEICDLKDILERDEFVEAESKFESAVQKYVKNPREYAKIYDESKKIMVIETGEHFRGLNSVVSTRISEKGEYRDWIVVVYGLDEDGEHLKASFRCQDWERRIDMGKLAGKIAKKLGGVGGGHPPAAGMRIPAEKKEELLKVLPNLANGSEEPYRV